MRENGEMVETVDGNTVELATAAIASVRRKGTVTRNPVVVAISKISDFLEGLETDAQRVAVLNFINGEYAYLLGN